MYQSGNWTKLESFTEFHLHRVGVVKSPTVNRKNSSASREKGAKDEKKFSLTNNDSIRWFIKKAQNVASIGNEENFCTKVNLCQYSIKISSRKVNFQLSLIEKFFSIFDLTFKLVMKNLFLLFGEGIISQTCHIYQIGKRFREDWFALIRGNFCKTFDYFLKKLG